MSQHWLRWWLDGQQGLIYWYGLTLIQALINYNMPSRVLVGITYPIPNSKVAPLRFGMNKQFHPTLYDGCSYLSILGLTINHVGKKGPRQQGTTWINVEIHIGSRTYNNLNTVFLTENRQQINARNLKIEFNFTCPWNQTAVVTSIFAALVHFIDIFKPEENWEFSADISNMFSWIQIYKNMPVLSRLV